MGLDISVREKDDIGLYTIADIHLNGGYREAAALIGADEVLWPGDQSEPFHAKALIPVLCACIAVFGEDVDFVYDRAAGMNVEFDVIVGVLCELLDICAQYPDADVVFRY